MDVTVTPIKAEEYARLTKFDPYTVYLITYKGGGPARPRPPRPVVASDLRIS